MTLGRPARLTIAHAMTLIAAASILILSNRPRHEFLFLLVLIVLELLLPWYFILRLGRLRSTAEACVALLAAAYLAWGALFLFHPNRLRMGLQDHHLRWNWGAVAIFYILVLAYSSISWMTHPRALESRQKNAGVDARRWNRAPIAGWLRLGLECLITASIFLFWSTWFAVVGLVATAFLAIVRVRGLHTIKFRSRSMSRVVRTIPGVLVGLTIGLMWTWVGWMPAAVLTALLVGGLVALRSPNVLIGRRARIAVLAALWAFAVFTQFVEPLRPRFSVSGYKPRKITALLPPPQQPPGKR